MSSSLPPLAWVRAFEASARRLSFAAAAKELGLTPAAVSQQIRALETHLGFTLFERLPRGVALTPMGEAWAPSVRRALDDLAVATAGLFGAGARRRLTVRAGASFAALLLAPRLPGFLAANPGLRLRLLTTTWGEAAAPETLDADIRYGDGTWRDADAAAEAIRLTEPVSIPVCPPDARFGSDPAADLRAVLTRGAIHVMGCENLWTGMARALGWPEAVVAGGAVADNSLVALELVAGGVGAAMIERALAAPAVASGRVVAAPGLALAHDRSHWLLIPRRARAPSPATLLFRAWAAETFAAPATAALSP